MLLPDGTDDGSVPLEEFSHLAMIDGQPGLPPDVIEELRQESKSPAAPPWSDPEDRDSTSGGLTEAGGADDIALPTEFDARHHNAFEGLLYLGSLTAEFLLAGHKFKIRTLTVGELLEVAQIQERYLNNLGSSRALVTAMVAGCIVLVDGKPLPQPLTTNISDTPLANAYRYIVDQWYPWIVDGIYEKFLVLEGRVNEILGAMGEASPSGL